LPDLVDALSDNDCDDTSPKNMQIWQPLTAEEWSKSQLWRFFKMKPKDISGGVYNMDEMQLQCSTVEGPVVKGFEYEWKDKN
jgi:hypothetical protein